MFSLVFAVFTSANFGFMTQVIVPGFETLEACEQVLAAQSLVLTGKEDFGLIESHAIKKCMNEDQLKNLMDTTVGILNEFEKTRIQNENGKV